MKKNFGFKIAACALLLCVAVLWLFSAIFPETFGEHSFAWLISIFAGGMAIIFVCKGALDKELTSLRKFYVFVGAVFAVAAVCALIGTFLSAVIALPVVAIVLSVAGLASLFLVQGKKWDAGDNQEPGYKNYYERKAEKEEKEKAGSEQNEEEK